MIIMDNINLLLFWFESREAQIQATVFLFETIFIINIDYKRSYYVFNIGSSCIRST
jgi:hypothetical protein